MFNKWLEYFTSYISGIHNATLSWETYIYFRNSQTYDRYLNMLKQKYDIGLDFYFDTEPSHMQKLHLIKKCYHKIILKDMKFKPIKTTKILSHLTYMCIYV